MFARCARRSSLIVSAVVLTTVSLAGCSTGESAEERAQNLAADVEDHGYTCISTTPPVESMEVIITCTSDDSEEQLVIAKFTTIDELKKNDYYVITDDEKENAYADTWIVSGDDASLVESVAEAIPD